MAVRMNLRIITKNYAVDHEKEFLTKSVSNSIGSATATSTALELKQIYLFQGFLEVLQSSY